MFKKRNIKNHGIDLNQIQEEEEDGDGNCKKKVKIDKIQMNNVISGSTVQRKMNTEDNIHKQFNSVNYKKGNPANIETEKILVGEEAINHETEQAKMKYLENIEMTKKIKQGKLSTKIYRGMNNYANYQLSQNQLNNPLQFYKFRHGPTRATNHTNIKNTCRFDYDPSLCKDWHDSGYCVFGNSCIYLHDRSNYKTGWELEKDFQQSERQRWARITNPNVVNSQPDHIKDLQKYKPKETCQVCNQTFKNPVQVQCHHIYCRKCAIIIFDKDSKCVQCNKKLNGIMNNAQKLLNKQKQNYQQMLKATQKNNNSILLTSKNNYKNINSLNVFINQ